MKYKTLFRLLLKVLGVWLTANGIVALAGSTLQVVSFAASQFFGGNPPMPVWWPLSTSVTGLAQVGLGLYLFFGGRWIADKAIPGNRPYCHECAYDLSYSQSNCCPECGTEFKAPG